MRRFVLIAALLLVGCKKDKPAAPPATGDAAVATKVAAPPEAAEALLGFKAAAAEVTAGSNVKGAFAGIGSKLDGLFGGGGAAADAEAEPGEAPPENVQFPPPAPKGGDCNAVADRVVLLMKAMTAEQAQGMSPEERKLTEDMMAGALTSVRVEVHTLCTQSWSQALRDCVLTAASSAELDKCARAAEEAEARAPSPTPPAAPAWTGGHECKDVGERMKQLVTTQVGGDLDASQAEIDEALADSAGQVVEVCTQGQWSEAVRSCMVRAPTLDDIGNCFGQI